MNNIKFTFIQKNQVVGVHLVDAKPYYNKTYNTYAFVKTNEVYIFSRVGELLYSNENFNIDFYDENCFVSINVNSINILKLTI